MGSMNLDFCSIDIAKRNNCVRISFLMVLKTGDGYYECGIMNKKDLIVTSYTYFNTF